MTIATEEVRPPPGPSRPSPKRVVVRVVGVAGRVFVGSGLLLLFFTGYLLWGTGVYTKQEQRRATETLARNPIVTEERLSGGEIPPARPTAPPRVGDPLFTAKVPRYISIVGAAAAGMWVGVFPRVLALMPANY